MSVLPNIAIYIAFQTQIEAGLAACSVKGKVEESKMSDTVLQIMQPTNSVEPPYQYMMIDGCKVKVNYLPKPSAPSAGKVLDRIHEILLASRLKK